MASIASGNTIAAIGRLVGEPARANLLAALMGGRALTAGELARHAGVTPQTTSCHLAKLADARLIACERQGRHRYYRLAGPEVAEAIHALMVVAAAGPRRHHPIGPHDTALRLARTCCDHMAGRLAIAVTDALSAAGYVSLCDGAGLVSDEGRRFFHDFGLDLDPPAPTRRPLCRTCLDWSERRPHLAGRLGAGLLQRISGLGWIRRSSGTRALSITPAGEAGLRATFRLPSSWRVADNAPAWIEDQGGRT
jgi:DNA-binding transcriptional ArsR family regulator